ncbi:Fc receptor-like protein 5 isoform X1 [Lepidochelys kempii]|uniref:Fc receptor-like protein 5 isoform X1 n=1 Tax=Lepidochelys kempii TaxID=8472 RepID=UPI003C6F184C
MALTLLLPVLASLQLLPRLVSPAANHPAPAFSVHPQKVEYLLGDTVGLTCSAPPAKGRVSVFQYYSNMGWAVSAKVSSGWKHTYNLSITEPRIAGSYSCNYYTGKPGHFVHSGESNRITIRVKDPPAEPTLSVDPMSGVVSEGHPLLITCTAPGDARELRFHFYQDGAKIIPGDAGSEISTAETRTSSMTVSVLSIPRVDTNSTGEYTCQYEEKQSERWILSTRSQAVTVTLKDPPPRPVLSMDPPSGEVNEGFPLLITCTAPGAASEWRFHFYKDGAKIVPGDVGSEISIKEPGTSSRNVSVLSIPRAGPNSAGVFTCGYEENVSGRWVPSPRSWPVNITVKDPLPLPVLSLDPPSGVVIKGVPLVLTCTVPGDDSEWRFHFYKDGAEIVPGDMGSEISTKESSTDSVMLTFPRAGPANSGEFTCGYEENVRGRWIPSPRSQAVNVTMKDPLPLPVLSLDPPSGVVIKGVPLVLTCTAPGDASEWRFHFYKDGAEIVPGDMGSEISIKESSMDSMMLTFPRAGPANSGEFTCIYEENVRGRWIPSRRSQAVNVTTKDPLPLPVLSLDPPSGVVIKGVPLVLTCTAPGDASEWRFHFYKDGAEIIHGEMGSEISTKESSTDSMMLTFPRAGPASSGEFTCVYEENVRGRWIPSPRSRAVNVTMKATWSLPIALAAGCVGAAVGLVLLLLLICFYKRKKKGWLVSLQPGSPMLQSHGGGRICRCRWKREEEHGKRLSLLACSFFHLGFAPCLQSQVSITSLQSQTDQRKGGDSLKQILLLLPRPASFVPVR